MKKYVLTLLCAAAASFLLVHCSSSPLGTGSESCLSEHANVQKRTLNYGQEAVDVNFIDIDSMLDNEARGRTSPMNAYFWVTRTLWDKDFLEPISLKGQLNNRQITINTIKGLVIYTDIKSGDEKVTLNNIYGALVYFVDQNNKLKASVYKVNESGYSLIEELEGFAESINFGAIQNVSEVLPYSQNSYRSAIIIFNGKQNYRTKRKKDFLYDRVKNYINTGT